MTRRGMEGKEGQSNKKRLEKKKGEKKDYSHNLRVRREGWKIKQGTKKKKGLV